MDRTDWKVMGPDPEDNDATNEPKWARVSCKSCQPKR